MAKPHTLSNGTIAQTEINENKNPVFLARLHNGGATLDTVAQDNLTQEHTVHLPQVQITTFEESASDSESDLPSIHHQGVAERRSASCVTFRSRVRITSGLNRHRRASSRTKAYNVPGFTPDSSRSCSPSSSISAPLRFHSEEPVAKPGWGTLGQRVSLMAQRGAERRQRKAQIVRSLSEPCIAAMQASENTPLLATAGPFYGVSYACECRRCRSEGRPQGADAKPTNLLDHYWWDSIRQILTCRCLDESDEE